MTHPFDYDHIDPLAYGGSKPEGTTFENARVAILPVPFDRTTTYVPGTRNAPREILVASSHMELWDEELNTDVHGVGIFTLPEMEFPFETIEGCLSEIRRVVKLVLDAGKFPVVLGGEHSITSAVVAAVTGRFSDVSVLQIDAHADLRDSYMGSPHNHACAMRRVLDHAPLTQVGIRSLSPEEAAAIPRLRTTVFYDITMRGDPRWIDRIIQTLGKKVYITIDCDGLDPAIMPATGTPEPGGLSWYEILSLLREVIREREVVGVDLVELSPIPGLVAPNFLCAKLIYKILTYRFATIASAATALPADNSRVRA